MSSPEEMQPQSGKHPGDAADDDIVVIDEETAVKEPSRGPRVPDRESSSAPVAGTETDQAGPTAGGGSVGMPPMAGQGPRTGPLTGAGAAPQTAGASPRAGDASPPGRDPRTAPPSTGDGQGTGPQAAGGAAWTPSKPSRAGPPASRNDPRWREIQGMFVDDPRDSVQRASDLIDTAIEEFLAEIRQRQAALASSWQNRDADTEVLRIALKDYRSLWAVVRDMPAVSAPGGAAAGAGVGGSSFGAGPGGPGGQHEPERGRTPA